jgi:hypothetical protein
MNNEQKRILQLETELDSVTITANLLPVAHQTIKELQAAVEEARVLARRLLPMRKPEMPGSDEYHASMLARYPWLKVNA